MPDFSTRSCPALDSHTGTIQEQQLKRVNLLVITAKFTCTEQYNVSLTDGSKLMGLSYKKDRQYGTGTGP